MSVAEFDRGMGAGGEAGRLLKCGGDLAIRRGDSILGGLDLVSGGLVDVLFR
ncbi:hypothetical protein [Halohasta litorea]|uniref:Uncharacterized protein n=1 Tax=Halohasta litorea TaxID=869891 RepID=A0ABD6DFC1_9EURY|nr:hypothetical protein [Halohasta litorea]